MKRLPQAIVWDLDGTLIDSAPDICRALNAVLAESGFGPLDEQPVRAMIGDGVPRLVQRGFDAVGQSLEDDEIDGVVRRFMLHYSANPVRSTRLYPGVSAALEALAAAGVRQGVCTNKPEAISWSILRELDIDKYFAALVGGDTTASKKPDPTPLQFCLDAMNANAGTALMIGDSAIDAATARALGMSVGLVTHGYARTDVRTIDADFLVEDLASLPAAIAERFTSLSAVAC